MATSEFERSVEDLIGDPSNRPANVERPCPCCGEIQSVHPAVGFPICKRCDNRWGRDQTWEERILLHTKTKTLDQILAMRGRTKYGDVADRVHAPAMFERAAPSEDVAQWAATPTSTLVLQGLPGRGKSYQAVAAMRTLLERRHGDGYLINCAGLGRMGRDEFRIWSDCAVLALDDFGARLTPACLASAYELIERRHSHMRPLVITTNITPAGIMKIDARIGSRLAAGKWIEMTGADRRLE